MSVDSERRTQIEKFIKIDDKIRSLLSRKLAEYAICHSFNISKNNLLFGVNNLGKPVLLSHPGIYFNISHCDHWLVCVVDEKSVGVDIEKITGWNSDTLQIFCNSDELLTFDTVKSQPQRYFQYWTIKEAVLKMVGTGLLCDPRDVFVSFLDESHISANFNNEIFYGETICTNDGYILSAINTNHISCPVSVSSDEFYK